MNNNPNLPLVPPPALCSPQRRRRAFRPLVISQSLLAEYQHLSVLTARRDILRQQIVSLLELQSVVEPGPLTARIQEVSTRRLSAKTLNDILGPEEVERLKQQVEPTISQRLLIQNVPGIGSQPDQAAAEQPMSGHNCPRPAEPWTGGQHA